MKRFIMRSGTVLCLALSSTLAHAQSSNALSNGKFAVSVNGTEKTEVTFRVSPAYPDNVLLEIQPSSPFLLNARIVNKKGVEQLKLNSEQVTLRYANSIDISKLAKGDYFIEITTGAGKSFKIAFTK